MVTPTRTFNPPLSGEFAIDSCGSCGNRISLRSPTSSAPASAWLCRRCGSVFFARCQEQDGQPFAGGTRLVPYSQIMMAINGQVEHGAPPVAQKDVKRLIECLATRQYNGKEARQQKRHPIAAPVTVVPLGADLRVAGEPARIVTLNISGGGLAVVHSRRITEPYLAIDFAASRVDLLPAILRVVRIRTLATTFEMAGKFLSRILQ